MFEIFLEKVKVFAYHGVNPEETKDGQYFYIDVLLKADLDLYSLEDNIENTVSYAAINKLIIKISTENTYKLIESLAVAISERILKEYPSVKETTVTVNKPNAPMRGEFSNVGVRYYAKR